MYDASIFARERSDWWARCDRALTFLLALYLFFVSQILLTTSMKTMLRFLPQIDSFCTGVLGDRNNTTVEKFLPCEFDESQISKNSTSSETFPKKFTRDENATTRVVDASSAVAASTATIASYRSRIS